MKKLDKLILSSFFGPFFITFFVVVFILLTQFMLRYFDEIVGKDLGVVVISQLVFYFSINMTTNALPLAVLLSSLMTFGNLGEHFELTAIKGSGISLVRTMRSLFLVSCVLVILGFFNNNYVVPQANLEAFSLLYDIKQKKPALDIKQGVFYHGIPGFSIKINEKFDDDITLKDIIIYDHAGQRGNKVITLADSGKMYNILDNRYLVLELFKGKSYSEQPPNNRRRINAREEANPYLRSSFNKSKMVFSLSEFDLKRTRKDLFSSNRLMKNVDQLKTDLDSMVKDYDKMVTEIELNSGQFFKYHMKTPTEVKQDIDRRPRKSTPLDTGMRVKVGKDHRLNKIDSSSVGSEASGKKRLRNSNLPLRKINDSLSIKTIREDHPVSLPVVTDSVKMAISEENGLMDSLSAEDSLSLSDSLLVADSLSIADSLFAVDSLVVNDSLHVSDSLMREDSLRASRGPYYKLDSMLASPRVKTPALGQALNHVRYVKGNLATQNIQMNNMIRQIRLFTIEKYKKLSMAMTIMAMFLIGAPLGAIIKRGGLGMPVLLSIVFFVLFYVISMLGEKWARQGMMSPLLGVWLANLFLFPVGIFFLRQARRDARLFDTDYYRVLWEKIRKKLKVS